MEEEKDIFNYLNKKENSVPDASYFQNMADSIIAKETQTKVIPLFKKPSFWMVAAAASLAFFAILNIQPLDNNNVLLSFNEISTTEAEAYISQNMTDFDTDLISEFVSEENIDDVHTESFNEKKNIEPTTSSLELDNIGSDEILDTSIVKKSTFTKTISN